MSQPLPVGNFKWMKESELENWREISFQEGRGCILEVDLEYPKELHNLHNDYPLAPERIVVNKVEKLLPNLWDKNKYVLHHRNLKQYLEMGMILMKIHHGVSFDEDALLKPYIEMNTKLRTEASNEFEKDFFKVMNNSVFGKTMENIRNSVDIRLRTDDKSAEKLVSKPNYERTTIFTEYLVAVHMKKTELVFNKPVYLGMSIPDISKTLMFDFHHNFIKKMYGPKAKLLMTDTDSLMYEIHTEDFFEDIRKHSKLFLDTSNIENSKLPRLNKKVPGKFKDEAGGKIISEVVGLRSKSYAFDMDGDEFKKCKGVKKNVVNKEITLNDYKNCLFSGRQQLRPMNVIRSHHHEVFTEQVNKIALSADDDKQIILLDRIHTRMRTDREAQGKAEGPWGGEFLCNFWASLRS